MNVDAVHANRLAKGSLTRTAVQATVHCLTGCAIGEILGMVIATALDLDDVGSIVLAVALAFVFGYALTLRPVLCVGHGFYRDDGDRGQRVHRAGAGCARGRTL